MAPLSFFLFFSIAPADKKPNPLCENTLGLLLEDMRLIHPIFFILALFLAGCSSGDPSPEKAILGTWVQETPTSMTARGIQTTTTDTVLSVKKNGESRLTRKLSLMGRNLPDTGIPLSIELKGHWELTNRQLTLTQKSAIILPLISDDIALKWANELQKQAEAGHSSVKNIVLANKEQLILQDEDTGATDTYRRK